MKNLKKLINSGKEHRALLYVLVFAVLIRILSIKNILIADEPHFYFAPLKELFSYHPPLFFLLQKLFIIPGVFWTARLVPFILGIANIALVYYIALNLFNKKTAIFSSLLMTISFWHVVASSMIDIDGSLSMFVYLLSFLFFFKYLNKKSIKYLFLLLLTILLIVWTKYTDALILIFVLSLIYLYSTKNLKKSIVFGIMLSLTAAISFGLLALFSYSFNFLPQFMTTIENATLGNKGFTLRPFLILILYATPLLVGLASLTLFNLDKKKKYIWLWVAGIFMLYFIFVRANRMPYERYLMTLIPALCILGGSYLSNLRFTKRQIFYGVICFICSYVLLLYLNLKNNLFIAHSVANYILALKEFKFNFMFPYVGSSGPSLWISFDSLLYGIGLSSIIFVLCLFYLHSKKTFNSLFILFLAISLSFSIFLIQEHTISLTTPSITRISNDLINFYDSHNLPNKVYVASYLKSIYIYLGNVNATRLDKTDENSLNELRQSKNSTILIIDFPTIDKNSTFWKEINRCDKIYSSSYKNTEIGYVFLCKNN